MKPTRRLASSHGIPAFVGAQEKILALMAQLAPPDLRGYPSGFDEKAAAILQEVARLAASEATALLNRETE